MRHICIVSPSLKIGGIERALSVLANFFVGEGYTVTFISCLKGEIFYTLDSRISFIEPEYKRTTSFLNKMLYYPRIAFYIRGNVVKCSPDVVLSFGDKFNPLVLMALLGIKIPIYISDRTNPDFPFNFLIRIGKKFLYPHSAGFIAQTDLAAVYKQKLFGNKLKITIIPNAIKNIQLTKVEKKPWILCVARLSYEKGVDRLIQAFALLESKGEWRLMLAGSGPMLEELKSQAIRLGIDSSVIFLGSVPDVDMLLNEASIFVLPSHREGFPNALCEAMAAGLPSICFDCIPTQSIIENGVNGIVVKNNDVKSMADMMQILIDNTEMRKSISVEAIKIREKLSVNKIGKLYLDTIFASSS